MSVALRIYRFASRFAEHWALRHLEKRLRRGKEDAQRLKERLGHPGLERPEGPLIWFHAASVGESVSLLQLIRRLSERFPGFTFLMTTGTVTSAEVISLRLPDRTLHQYVPLDVQPAVRRFFDHWRPDIAIWTESELWPNLILEAHSRDIPLFLINARMSEKSYRRWRLFRGSARKLLSCFDAVLAQDNRSASHYRRLGARPEAVEVTGTLKEGAAPLPYVEAERRNFAKHFEGRTLWCAASTHQGEEKLVIDAFRIAQRHVQGLMLILVPRHPERGGDAVQIAADAGLKVEARTEKSLPDRRADVYVADTLGELGLWYRLCAVSFIGGSLVPVGGHNPYEPAALGSAILHGPHVANFRDAYARLKEVSGAREVTDAESLAIALAESLQPQTAAEMATAAWDICSAGAGTTDQVIDRLTVDLERLSR